MSPKTADNIVSLFEVIIVALPFAGWAALGFPQWKPFRAFGLLRILGVVVLR
jgi:hypothetical protein